MKMGDLKSLIKLHVDTRHWDEVFIGTKTKAEGLHEPTTSTKMKSTFSLNFLGIPSS
jgi:hypothetical protein